MNSLRVSSTVTLRLKVCWAWITPMQDVMTRSQRRGSPFPCEGVIIGEVFDTEAFVVQLLSVFEVDCRWVRFKFRSYAMVMQFAAVESAARSMQGG